MRANNDFKYGTGRSLSRIGFIKMDIWQKVDILQKVDISENCSQKCGYFLGGLKKCGSIRHFGWRKKLTFSKKWIFTQN